MSFVRGFILTVFAHLLLVQPALADRTIEGRSPLFMTWTRSSLLGPLSD
jgi:hypothetical protein